jgi:REP element-mobilizing transposase RayT
MVRGNNRLPIFIDDLDRQRWLMLMSLYKQRFSFRLYAYVLMPNHVHLVLQPASGTTISRIMQCLTIAYAKYLNARHKRVGHVFQGRFKSRLIDNDSYLLVATRYVHLNPVKAKLAAQPSEYHWGSYRAYLDVPDDPMRLVDPDLILALAAPGNASQQSAYRQYRQFVEFAMDSPILDPLLNTDI